MDLEEARSLFRRYKGRLYQMAREVPDAYHAFAALSIAKDTLEQWRQELIEEYFDQAKADPAKAWLPFSDIVRILQSTLTLKEENGERVLDLLETILSEEDSDKGLIMSLVYGNTVSRNDSLLCWIEKNTSLKEKLGRILNDSADAY
ncbi:MAG: hypothetical protein K5648_07565 [Erysipelotrichaceae bacterium]|nr:hypothetical protein [Erysipelotrichaceae bacterium]